MEAHEVADAQMSDAALDIIRECRRMNTDFEGARDMFTGALEQLKEIDNIPPEALAALFSVAHIGRQIPVYSMSFLEIANKLDDTLVVLPGEPVKPPTSPQ